MGMSEFSVLLIILVIAALVGIAGGIISWRTKQFVNPRSRRASGHVADYSSVVIDRDAINDSRVQRHLPESKIMAIKVYRELTGVGLKEAKDAVEAYLAQQQPGIYDDYREPPLTQDDIKTKLVSVWDERVQKHLPHNKIEAIKAYREISDVSLKEAKDAVEYSMAHPEEAKKHAGETSPPLSDAGVRDLLNEGKFEDAVKAYKTFAGVDYFSARNAVEAIQREMQLPVPERAPLKPGHPIFDRDVQGAISVGDYEGAVSLYKLIAKVDDLTARGAVDELMRRAQAASIPPDTSGVPEDDVRNLLREGKKIEAVKRVREATNLGLKEALDVVNEIERKLKLS